MGTLTVFCSACDRNVPLVQRSEGRALQLRSLPCMIGDVSCLEHGVRCTGTLCPFHSVGPVRVSGVVMTDRGTTQPSH
jgi:hypothetical protein